MANEFSGRKNIPTHKKTRRASMRDARIIAARTEAAERQAAHDKLSLKEKLAKLDMILGCGQGAARERARLNTMLVQEIQKAQQIAAPADGTVTEEKPQKKTARNKKVK